MGALKAYVDGVVETSPGSEIALITFDNKIKIVAQGVKVSSFKLRPEWVTPRGTTALRDAIQTGIELGDNVEAKTKATGKTVEIKIAIFTDGQDNASANTPRGIAAMIEERKKRGNWDFTFLAANQDAVTAASTMNIDRKDAISVGRARGAMRSAMTAACRST